MSNLPPFSYNQSQTYDSYNTGSNQQYKSTNNNGYNNNIATTNTNYNNYNDKQDVSYYNGFEEERVSLSSDTAPMRPRGYPYGDYDDGMSAGGRRKDGSIRVRYRKERKGSRCCPCLKSRCARFTCFCCLFLLIIII